MATLTDTPDTSLCSDDAESRATTSSGHGPKLAWPLLAAITFLSGLGMTIVLPVLPFITLQFVSEQMLGWWVGVLEAVYAACAFLVAPLLGRLSDRFGRRPVLVYSVLVAAVGYVMFGLAGSLFTLVVARIIQGFAAGDMPALFAYVADITKAKDRAKRYGLLGALSGVAMMVGPGLGGLLARISLSAPVFATAGLSVLVGVLALVVLPESLAPENRATGIALRELNPLSAIRKAFARPSLRPLLVGAVLVMIPFIFFATNSPVLAFDIVGWGPTEVGVLLTVIGVLDIAVQGGLLVVLLPRIGERGVIIAGIAAQAVGCLGLAIAASLLHWPWLLACGFVVLAAGEGGMNAALQGVMSSRVGADEQGWLAGSFSSLSSAIQVAAPLLAGLLYASLAHSAPYWLGFVLILASACVLRKAIEPVANRPKTLAHQMQDPDQLETTLTRGLPEVNGSLPRSCV